MRCLIFATIIALIPPAIAPAQSAEEIGFVTSLFERLQPLSFAKHREYCGFVGRDAAGRLVATDPRPGNRDSCELEWPRDMAVIATYHTHGAFDFAYHNEMPSDTDLLSDRSYGVDGWVATPGGRLWFVDHRRMTARQICPVGCLPIAPGFYKSQAGDVADSYTYDELVERLSR